MPTTHRSQVVRDSYRAYETQDRALIEACIGEPFIFYSPPDPGLDRTAYFERCWPNASKLQSFEFTRLVEFGDEVLVTYEATKTDGHRFRNTEIFTFEGPKICQVEVYFGWDLR
jgi:ketosteroid isomerase-like protein